MIDLFCEFDEDNRLIGITDFNDIEVTNGLDFRFFDEEIKYT